MKIKNKNVKLLGISLICFIIILPVVWILMVRLEGGEPSIQPESFSSHIGMSRELSISVSDIKSGVRRIWVGLLKDGKEIVLLEKDFPGSAFGGGNVHKDSIKILIEPKKLGITDGKGILRMVAWDFSWRRWWHGNKIYVEHDVLIDTKRPEIEILSRVHNIAQGGSGLVIYKMSEPCPKSGVYVGKNYFPGHPGMFKDTDILVAFIALNYNQGTSTGIFTKATDFAGNTVIAGFPFYIKKRRFKKDILNITDRFLNWKMPEFDTDIPQDSQLNMVDKFLKINRELRETNYRKVTGIGEKTANAVYWEGPFLRLPNSARKASFADHREYKYNGRIIDHQFHLGVDLASVQHAPVPASNKGKVVLSEYIGIYGKTVVIDHGFGLFSMYSHLSRFNVQKGQIVLKGDIIGKTGRTGLAGGDHLHFGMFVHNTFVNPIEWWDAAWIKNNITGKIDDVKAMLK